MKKIILFLLISNGLITTAFAQTEVLYVSDRLYLGLYPEATTEKASIATLKSGDALSVLERLDGFVRIQTADGKEGWVRENFVSKDKPVSLIAAALKTERDRLRTQVANSTPNEEVTVIKNDLSKAENQIAELKKLLDEQLKANNEVTQLSKPSTPVESSKQVQNTKESSSWKQAVLWLLFTFAAGVVVGVLLISARIKKRFGGYKVW